jgi:hypothetical protein
VGATCGTTSECAKPSAGAIFCAGGGPNDEETGVCQVTLRGQEGDGPCPTIATNSGTVTSQAPRVYYCSSADGLFCNEVTAKCSKLGAVGSSCADSTMCARGTYCDPSGRKCVVAKVVGEACDPNVISECGPAVYCTIDTDRCTAFLLDGAACSDSTALCLSLNCVNGRCANFDQQVFEAFCTPGTR